MQLLTNLKKETVAAFQGHALFEKAKESVIALGNFDGLHVGHQAVLGQAARLAQRLALPFGVVTCEPHPVAYFRPERPCFRLTPFPDQVALMADFGLDWMLALPFDAALAATEAQSFIEQIILGVCRPAHVFVGYDYHFGKDRGGNVALLERLSREKGFKLHVMQAVGAEGGGQAYSSTGARAALQEGRPQEAAAILGRFWSITAMVEKGDQRGRLLGFPTANMALKDYLLPRYGVYAVKVKKAKAPRVIKTENGLIEVLKSERNNILYEGVANFGIRPSFDKHSPLLEAHLFGLNEDLYNHYLEVYLVDYLRGEQKFDTLDGLKAQIMQDRDKAQNRLSVYRDRGLLFASPEAGYAE